MTLKEIEEQKNLINACRKILAQAKTDYEETANEIEELKIELNKIWHKEYNLNNKIYDLEQVVVAELDEEELANELNALDENPDPCSYYTGLDVNEFVEIYPNIDDNAILDHKKRDIKQFDFKTEIHIKTKKCVLHSHYSADELINGKPLIQYFKINSIDKTIDPRTVEVYFGFDADFYNNHFKIRLTLSEMKKYPTLETAVMNILKRHEQTEGV